MIYYILGGTVLVTFIACLIHYFASDSDLSDFFTEKFGWITISMCLTVGLCIIGCIYWELWASLIIGITVIAAFCFCIYYYNDMCCYSLSDFFIDEYGWVIASMFLVCGASIIGMIYWHFWWSFLILSTVGASVTALIIYYDDSASSNLYELLVKESGWVFPLLFVSIASTIACAILISVGHSLIIGLTVIIMLIASIIHYSSEMCSGFRDFFIDENGWVTNLIVLTIGATVYGSVYGNLFQSLYIGISVMILIIACIIHYTSSSSIDFEDFFVDEKGWLTISTVLLIEASICGFISWSPAKTFIVICDFIAMVVGAVVHWNVTKSTKFSDFFYFDNGYLTVSAIAAVGYGIYAFAFYHAVRALIAILALCLGIVGTAIYKIKAKERYFVTFYAVRLGALAFAVPSIIGGILIAILYSSYAYLIAFGLIGIISYLCALFKALSNKSIYFPPKPIPKPIPKPKPKTAAIPTPLPKTTTPPTPSVPEKTKYDEPIIVEMTGKAELYINTEDK